MAKKTGIRPKRRRRPLISPVLRPLAWSALLSAAVAFAFASPVYADPARPTTVPDIGSRPAVAGALLLPGATAPGSTGPRTPLPPLLNGPLATQIQAKETQLALLGRSYSSYARIVTPPPACWSRRTPSGRPRTCS